MVFSSIVFITFFLMGVLLFYYNPLVKSRKYKNIVLLLASLFFYAWGETKFVFLLMFSIIVNYYFGILISKNVAKKRKIIFIISLIYNILMIFVFKYLSFTISNIAFIFKTNWKIEMTLPLGISFFTFQIISYIVDVYKNKIPAQKNIMYLGLYISMFPQLVAGPIVRYETIANEIENRKENWEDFSAGLYRFILGLAKKVLIANNVALLVDRTFGANSLSVASAWLGAIAYTIQIYFDFSGYSDMAIGLGKMFGFHFNENFDYPYMSKSVTEFWRKWHMSLSSWFKDYVYIPLGGNRVSRPKWIRNLFVVWLLTGLWHGANWTFIIWGLYYVIIILTEKLIGYTKKMKFASYIYTMPMVIIGWVIFRSNTITSGLTYVGKMFGINSNGIIDDIAINYIVNYRFYLLIGILASLPIKKWINFKKWGKATYFYLLQGMYITVVLVLCISRLLTSNYNPFIYFNF